MRTRQPGWRNCRQYAVSSFFRRLLFFGTNHFNSWVRAHLSTGDIFKQRGGFGIDVGLAGLCIGYRLIVRAIFEAIGANCLQQTHAGGALSRKQQGDHVQAGKFAEEYADRPGGRNHFFVQ